MELVIDLELDIVSQSNLKLVFTQLLFLPPAKLSLTVVTLRIIAFGPLLQIIQAIVDVHLDTSHVCTLCFPP